MPKEHVNSCFARAENEPASPGDLTQYRAEVLWGANDYVQIATINPDALLGSVESGLYVDLNRRGINDLIRLLRKARDRAYGRDE